MTDYYEELRAPSTVIPGRRARRRRRLPALVPPRRVMLLVAVVGITAVALVTAANLYAAAAANSLPGPGTAAVLARSIVVYDRGGKVLAEHNQQGTYHVVQRLSEMGHWGPAATLAAEDRDFYRHGALNLFAVARAIFVDTLSGHPLQGGSTITQQLVKIELAEPQKSFTRKVREAMIANELERRYSKDQILEMYLNRVYYGHRAYGIGAAAKSYFGKDKEVKDLTPAQAAFLAGLLQAPSANDPQLHFERAQAGELHVLQAMVAIGVLSQAESSAARAEKVQAELKFDTTFRQAKAPHFVDYVLSRLEAQFGSAAVQQGGLAVTSTIDPDVQALAERAVASGVAAMAQDGVNNGMLLAARPDTGEILAWVGSADYGNAGIGGQFDVVLSPRQPGSSFKPYVYEAALHDHKITLASCVHDEPTDFGGYQPLDFDNSYFGTMTAREALLQSRNIPAVEVAQREGISGVINLARAMGIRTKLQPYLSTAIGSSEVTMFDHLQGYQVLADAGRRVPLMSISRITDAGGGVLFQQQPGQQADQQQVVSAAEAYLITDTLKDYQTTWSLGWDRRMAGKSGTSGGSEIGVHQDAWMMAYNPDIVVGGWAGNTGAAGAGGATSAFGVNTGQTMLAEFINHLPSTWRRWYQRPPDLVSRRSEIFLPGTERLAPCGGGDSGGPPGRHKKDRQQPTPPPTDGSLGGGD